MDLEEEAQRSDKLLYAATGPGLARNVGSHAEPLPSEDLGIAPQTPAFTTAQKVSKP